MGAGEESDITELRSMSRFNSVTCSAVYGMNTKHEGTCLMIGS